MKNLRWEERLVLIFSSKYLENFSYFLETSAKRLSLPKASLF